MDTTPSVTAAEIRGRLEDDFGRRVALFYRALQITPPYHSVEKAKLAVHDALASLQEPVLQATAADPVSLGTLFTKAVIDSGLAKKHRGIITGLLADHPERLPPECQPFADAFRR
jgi:hypothetical protein